MARISSPELDSLLGVKFPVLDDGFVRAVDYMGGDESVVRAARISYGEGTRPVNDDVTLIRYLMRHQHMTPFEMPSITLHVRVPMDVWRQWIRHRTAKVNEYSTRYSVAIDSAAKASEWRLQAKNNKQGSAGSLDDVSVEGKLSEKEAELHRLSREIYEERLAVGVAHEQARKDLPLSTYTEAIWTCDLRNLLHFLGLRMDSHAQWEIRQYANVIGDIVSKWAPITWEAFTDYSMNSVKFSAKELSLMNVALKTCCEGACDGLSKREREEFMTKVRRINGTDGTP